VAPSFTIASAACGNGSLVFRGPATRESKVERDLHHISDARAGRWQVVGGGGEARLAAATAKYDCGDHGRERGRR
jgi:hypothetical protein